MIFTIGYGCQKSPRLPALKLEELAHVREQLGAVIIDVRARPYSKWRKEVNSDRLAERFVLNYLPMSHRLGNQSRELPGRVTKEGIDWLEARSMAGETLLLLCLEKPPGDCHRHHAIAMQLEPGSVFHLYHDGEEWTSIEAHELQRSIDENRDYRCLGLGDPFNADFLRSAGILPWPAEIWEGR